MRKIVSEGVIKKYFYILELKDLVVSKFHLEEGMEDVKPYLVNINGIQKVFQYDGDKFYLDVNNNEKQEEEMEEHKKVVEVMQEEGKTEEEIREYITGKGNEYIDKVECIIDCDGLLERLNKAITSL